MQVLCRVSKVFRIRTIAVKVFADDRPVSYVTLEDDQLNDVQIGFESPDLMREIARAMLAEADKLEKEINT